jgi:hypothetical protein
MEVNKIEPISKVYPKLPKRKPLWYKKSKPKNTRIDIYA